MKFEIAEKVYFLIFAVIILFTAYRIFHSQSLLETHESPTTVVHLFDLNNDLLYNVVTIFSVILLLISNIFFWGTGRGIFFFWSLLYFTAGIIFLAYLEHARFHYIRQTGLWNGKLSSGLVVSLTLVSGAIVFTVINYLIIKFIRNQSFSRRRRS
ncbi:MAG: hypothetical protein KGM98_15835 [Bacteroidota bacterium]|nr:hypothetical protein [Bacteroidota bacterium]